MYDFFYKFILVLIGVIFFIFLVDLIYFLINLYRENLYLNKRK